MRHVVPARGLLASVFAVLIGALIGSPAAACPAPPAWSGFVGTPVNGETEVPTDIVPLYKIAPRELTSGATSFSLVTETGAPVSIAVRSIAQVGSKWTAGCWGSWVE